MSMNDLLEGLERIKSNPDSSHFSGEKSESLVAAAERRLEVKFPPTYRKFLLELGAGNYDAAEFYGVIDGNFEESSVPDGIWLSLTERREIALPKELIVNGATGYGELYCIDTVITPEGPIIIYQSHLRPDEQNRERVADDFGAFFLREINFWDDNKM